jgi:RNA polymerase sigma factor (sigma-70 family)
VNLPPFQRLVDEHWRDVARLAHALAGPDGDDVAQQAWAQALAAYPRLGSASNLRGWLMTVTARCAMDVHRSRARRAVPVPDLAGAAVGPLAADPADGLPDEALWARVARLPERQRAAITLRYVADLDHAQVAAALDTTAAASRRLVSDALAVLRADDETRSA